MPLDVTATEPASAATAKPPTPPFTECVSNGKNGERHAESRDLAKRLQDLIERIQSHPNPGGKALLQECLQTLLAFYGDGLSRIVTELQQSGPETQALLNRLAGEPAVSGLLLIHGLHPLALETRLRGALEKVRPYMQSHGGNIELLNLENDVARVKLEGTCKSCPSSAITLELAVRRAVEEACPDLLAFEVIGGAPATV